MTDTETAGKLREIIRMIERKLGILQDGELACCGLTLSQCHTLVEIGRAGTISLSELAKLINLDNSTMSRTVNNLVNRKMVKRELDPNDRRYVTIQLTLAGNRLYTGIEDNMERCFLKITRSIPEDKREQVMDSLQLLLNAFIDNECCLKGSE